mmetsp:Transcript_112746/g.240652  ORF Transcript_112746/g.240652 Transcript_112746/m.240652 type:complete len:82 (+) Transcript_112746:233-478(+)
MEGAAMCFAEIDLHLVEAATTEYPNSHSQRSTYKSARFYVWLHLRNLTAFGLLLEWFKQLATELLRLDVLGPASWCTLGQE